MIKKRKYVKTFPSLTAHMKGSADLRFLKPSARHQFLHCETTDTGPVYCAVCLFTSQCPGAELNLRLRVTSGLQV